MPDPIPADHPAVAAAHHAYCTYRGAGRPVRTASIPAMAAALDAALPLTDLAHERDRAIEALREIVAVTGVLSDITAHKTYRIATAVLRDLGIDE